MAAAMGCGIPSGESSTFPCQKRMFSVRSGSIGSEILTILSSLKGAGIDSEQSGGFIRTGN